jgi:hypothetical protein
MGRPIENKILTTEEVNQSDSNPVEFLYPYLSRLVSYLASQLENPTERLRSAIQWSIRNEWDDMIGIAKESELKQLLTSSSRNLFRLSQLATCLTNVQRFRRYTTRTEEVVVDFEELTRRMTTIQDLYRREIKLAHNILSREVSTLAITESGRSMEQAVNVKREYHT